MEVIVPIAGSDEHLFEDVVEITVYPDVLYDSAQACAILGIRGQRKSRLNALYKIPADRLVVQRRGPKGGLRAYLGRDLLTYRGGR